MSVEVSARPETSVWLRLGRFAKRALLLELSIYANIGRFIARRQAVCHEGRPVSASTSR